MPKARNLFLTEPQAACLIALRHGRDSQSKIAVEAKLSITKTTATLGALAKLGLAERNQAKAWHATRRGKTCRVDTVPDRPRRRGPLPGPGRRSLHGMRGQTMRRKADVKKPWKNHYWRLPPLTKH